jgi:Amidohydrolase
MALPRIISVGGTLGFNNAMASLADTIWEQHNSWMHTKDRILVPPSTQYYGRVFGCFTADRHGLRPLEEVGVDDICFEADYPHTDTTWPYSEAYIEKPCAGLDAQTAYKILRGNAITMLGLDRV